MTGVQTCALPISQHFVFRYFLYLYMDIYGLLSIFTARKISTIKRQIPKIMLLYPTSKVKILTLRNNQVINIIKLFFIIFLKHIRYKTITQAKLITSIIFPGITEPVMFIRLKNIRPDKDDLLNCKEAWIEVK